MTGNFTSFLGRAAVAELYEFLWKAGYAHEKNNVTLVHGTDGYAVVVGYFHVYGEGNQPAIETIGQFWKVILKDNGTWYSDLDRFVFPPSANTNGISAKL